MIFFKKKTQEINWTKAASHIASYLEHFAQEDIFALAKPHARFVIDKSSKVNFYSDARNPNHYLGWGDLAFYALAEDKISLMEWAQAMTQGSSFAPMETDQFARKITSKLMGRTKT